MRIVRCVYIVVFLSVGEHYNYFAIVVDIECFMRMCGTAENVKWTNRVPDIVLC
jgi:hypothetical protein